MLGNLVLWNQMKGLNEFISSIPLYQLKHGELGLDERKNSQATGALVIYLLFFPGYLRLQKEVVTSIVHSAVPMSE